MSFNIISISAQDSIKADLGQAGFEFNFLIHLSIGQVDQKIACPRQLINIYVRTSGQVLNSNPEDKYYRLHCTVECTSTLVL